jgi:ABC-type transport system involved in cytochrome c biogenesis permease component
VDRERIIPKVAVALYVVYWVAVLFGYVRLDSSDFAGGVFELLRAAAVALPAVALGYAVGSWRATLAGLVFLFAVALPERTVVDGSGVDVTLIGTYGVSIKEALALIAVTTPCVIVGIAARRGASARRARAPRRAAAAREAGQAERTPSP